MTNIARRNTLLALAALSAGVMLVPRSLIAQKLSEDAVGRLLEMLIPDLAAAKRLGQAYLAAYPNEFDRQLLTGGVLASLRVSSGAGLIGSIEESILVSKARRTVTDDYVAGRVVDVDGWVLSVTEARLYALTVFDDSKVR